MEFAELELRGVVIVVSVCLVSSAGYGGAIWAFASPSIGKENAVLRNRGVCVCVVVVGDDDTMLREKEGDAIESELQVVVVLHQPVCVSALCSLRQGPRSPAGLRVAQSKHMMMTLCRPPLFAALQAAALPPSPSFLALPWPFLAFLRLLLLLPFSHGAQHLPPPTAPPPCRVM